MGENIDEASLSLAVTIPTIILSIIVASRALRMQRPVPGPDDKVALLRNVKFRTGDIILFHSNPFITTFSDGPWSHVGIVIVGNSGAPRLFEITGSGACLARARRLHPMIIESLESGDRVVAMRRLSPAPSAKHLQEFAARCIRQRHRYDHFYWVTTFDRIFGAFFPIQATREGMGEGKHTCSSIVADALVSAKVLPESTATLEVLPSDYENGNLRLRSPYKFGPLIFLRMKV